MDFPKALAFGLAIILVWFATAQMRVGSGHALDSSLRVGGSRVNARQRALPVQRDIYTVNRHTGGMRYNRAAAFDSTAYAPWQRRYGSGDPMSGNVRPLIGPEAEMVRRGRPVNMAYRRQPVTGMSQLTSGYQQSLQTGALRRSADRQFAQPTYGALDAARRAGPPPGYASDRVMPTGLGVGPQINVKPSVPFGTAAPTYLQPQKYKPTRRRAGE
jgi:hypothetical protein